MTLTRLRALRIGSAVPSDAVHECLPHVYSRAFGGAGIGGLVRFPHNGSLSQTAYQTTTQIQAKMSFSSKDQTASAAGCCGGNRGSEDHYRKELNALMCHRRLLERKKKKLQDKLEKIRSAGSKRGTFLFVLDRTLPRLELEERGLISRFSCRHIRADWRCLTRHNCPHTFLPKRESFSTISGYGPRLSITSVRSWMQIARSLTVMGLHSVHEQFVLQMLASVVQPDYGEEGGCDALRLRSLEVDLDKISGDTRARLLGYLFSLASMEKVNHATQEAGPDEGCGALQTLGLKGINLTDGELKVLCEMCCLRRLDLREFRELTDLFPLSTVLSLEEISLWKCTGVKNLSPLAGLPALRLLNLHGTMITDDELQELGACRSLQKIDLSECPNLSDVSCLASIVTLEEINLSNCHTLSKVGNLGKLPVLRDLNLSHTGTEDTELKGLSESRSLVYLRLNNCHLQNVNALASVVTLNELHFSECYSLTKVGDLGNLPSLRKVNFHRTGITNREVKGLSRSRSLVSIIFAECSSLTNVSPLKAITTLEELHQWWCTGLSRIRGLHELPALCYLNISGSRINNNDVALIGRSPSIRVINFGMCRDVTNVCPLASLLTLEEAHLWRCYSMTKVGALGKLPALTLLRMGETPVTDEELEQISESRSLVRIEIQECRKLTNVCSLASILTLEDVDLRDSRRVSKVSALGKLPALRRLVLKGTAVNAEEKRQLNQHRCELGLLPMAFE